MLIEIEDDAFADAQIRSKIEVCVGIEGAFSNADRPIRIDLYAGWYGMIAFLLLTRFRVDIGKIRSFDVDPEATAVARRLNRCFMISAPIFQPYTYDVNNLRPQPDEVDLIVNTAVEHMDRQTWFTSIPSGTMVALQGTNLVHPNEIVPNPIASLSELGEKYPLEPVRGEFCSPVQLDFEYPGMKFSRFQIIGRKR